MKTISRKTLAGLPSGIQESIIERSIISASISNANTFLKYAKDCLKWHKENPDQHWEEQAKNSLLPYYEKLLSNESLAKKYHALWGEKYYKCKLQCEKILEI